MRMRKKKNTAQRIEKCADLLLENREEIEKFPVNVEIGCGKGRFILELAKRCPDRQFVAMELVSDVAMMAMEKVREAGLTNVRFIIGDAMSLVDIFKKGDIERIYLNFSDPWTKNGTARKRLTHRGFLEVYKNLLTKDGEIIFKTDNRELFDFSLEEFRYMGFEVCELTYDLHNSEYNKDNIITEYEENFTAKGFRINRVCARMSEFTNIEIIKAGYGDLDRISEIIGKAVEYFRGAGIPQWQNGYPSREIIKKDIDDGYYYVAKIDGEIVAGAYISAEHEPTYDQIDGAWLNDSKYCCIHRICVDNRYKGKGIAGAIVRKAEDIARHNRSRNLRCDTHEKNKSMRRMLEKNGFLLCGNITLENGDPRVAYQKKMK